MKRLFLHAGHYKTGTTSAQQGLAAHRPLLREHGIVYPDYGGDTAFQHGLYLSFWRDEHAEHSLEHWRREAEVFRSAPQTHFILSAETAAYLTRENFRQLRDVFFDFELTLVFTMRHWAGFCPSLWSEFVRWGDSLTFPELLSRVDRDFDESVTGDFSLPLRRAAGSVDRLVAVPYRTGRALQLLYDALGVPADIAARIITDSARQNKSPSYMEREGDRVCNVIVNEKRGRRPDGEYLHSVASAPHARAYLPPTTPRAFIQSDKPEAVKIRGILRRSRQDRLASDWAPLFDRWRLKLDASLKEIGLGPMPEDWGRDELSRTISFSEIGLADLPLRSPRAFFTFSKERRAAEGVSADFED